MNEIELWWRMYKSGLTLGTHEPVLDVRGEQLAHSDGEPRTRFNRKSAEEAQDYADHAVRRVKGLMKELYLGGTGPELTTQEAADALNMSRPTLIKLLHAGKMHYRKVGNRYRVRSEDVLAHWKAQEVGQ